MRRGCRARLRTLSRIAFYQSSSLPPEACRSIDDIVVGFQCLICLSLYNLRPKGMLRCPSAIVVKLSESFRQDDRVRICHAAWTRIRRACHDSLWRSGKSVQELNAHQQGEVLVHRVVAVVDIGPAVFAELDLERDLSGRTQPPHVLADEALCCRNGVVAAIDRNAFLEVQVDRVIPSAATVNIGPVLDGSRLLVLELDAVSVHRMRLAVIDDDGPRE